MLEATRDLFDLSVFFWLEVSTLAERNMKKLLVEYDPTRQTFKVLTGGTDLLRSSFKPQDLRALVLHVFAELHLED